MSRLTRDGTAEPVSRDQVLRRERGQINIIFSCAADHEQDWQPYPVDPYSAICDNHDDKITYVPTTLCISYHQGHAISKLQKLSLITYSSESEESRRASNLS